jgi:hypothetical protein
VEIIASYGFEICGAQAEHVRNLRCIFLCFEATLGLRINLGKSELVPIGEVEDVDNLAHNVGCRVVFCR